MKNRIQKSILELIGADPYMSKLGDDFSSLAQAKFIRGVSLMELAEANGTDSEDALGAAVGIELVHMATLVHDDVLDDSPMRRAKASFKSVHGEKSAILFGDYLYSLALERIANTQNLSVTRQFATRVLQVCRGESIQDLFLDSEVNENLLTEVIQGKTGALFAFCFETPAHMKEDFSDTCKKALARVGLMMGGAFQLVDDILDIVADESMSGKPQGTDLAREIVTIPLYHLMKELQMDWKRMTEEYGAKPQQLAKVFQNSGTQALMLTRLEQIRSECSREARVIEVEGFYVSKILEKFWEQNLLQRISYVEEFNLS